VAEAKDLAAVVPKAATFPAKPTMVAEADLIEAVNALRLLVMLLSEGSLSLKAEANPVEVMYR
jgi:hypothetical protein